MKVKIDVEFQALLVNPERDLLIQILTTNCLNRVSSLSRARGETEVVFHGLSMIMNVDSYRMSHV